MLLAHPVSASRKASSLTILVFGLVVLFCYTTKTINEWRIYFATQRINNLHSLPQVLPDLSNISTTTPPPPPPKQKESSIPKHIWYKLGPNGLSKDAREWTNTCLKQNPSYKSTFVTDTSADVWVREAFKERQDIVDTYLALSVPIHKADLLRYLLLYAEGGIWSDLDVSCLEIPIQDWIPEEHRESANLVVGWEFDIGCGDNLYIRQFTTWWVMAKPRSPHLMRVIEDILSDIHFKTLEFGVGIEGLTLNMTGDVVDFTGPRRLTRGIFRNLAGEKYENRTVEMKEVGDLSEPRMLSDVLIMPQYSFAWESGEYQEGDRQGPRVLTHHYAGSWKNDNGGELKDR